MQKLVTGLIETQPRNGAWTSGSVNGSRRGFRGFYFGRNDEALAQLLQVSQRDGARYPVSYFHLARLYELKGDLKQAETAFAQAVDAYGSNNAQPLLDLSRVREKQGNFKGALEAMERYVTVMQQQGLKPVWGDERIAELRAKAQ